MVDIVGLNKHASQTGDKVVRGEGDKKKEKKFWVDVKNEMERRFDDTQYNIKECQTRHETILSLSSKNLLPPKQLHLHYGVLIFDENMKNFNKISVINTLVNKEQSLKALYFPPLNTSHKLQSQFEAELLSSSQNEEEEVEDDDDNGGGAAAANAYTGDSNLSLHLGNPTAFATTGTVESTAVLFKSLTHLDLSYNRLV